MDEVLGAHDVVFESSTVWMPAFQRVYWTGGAVNWTVMSADHESSALNP